MNNTLVFVLLIVAMCLCANVVQTFLKRKHKDPEPSPELEDTLTKIELLEERIQVLELNITDNKFDLKSEIDSL